MVILRWNRNITDLCPVFPAVLPREIPGPGWIGQVGRPAPDAGPAYGNANNSEQKTAGRSAGIPGIRLREVPSRPVCMNVQFIIIKQDILSLLNNTER